MAAVLVLILGPVRNALIPAPQLVPHILCFCFQAYFLLKDEVTLGVGVYVRVSVEDVIGQKPSRYLLLSDKSLQGIPTVWRRVKVGFSYRSSMVDSIGVTVVAVGLTTKVRTTNRRWGRDPFQGVGSFGRSFVAIGRGANNLLDGR